MDHTAKFRFVCIFGLILGVAVTRVAGDAHAHESSAPGSQITGDLTFTPIPTGGVLVTGYVQGLTPGNHGFHVHQNPVCDPNPNQVNGSFASAGPHFNPTNSPHGGVNGVSHVGDLGNIVANGQGRANVYVYKQTASLNNGANSYLRRAIIIHANGDDLQPTTPTGNSGGRLACGLIG